MKCCRNVLVKHYRNVKKNIIRIGIGILVYMGHYQKMEQSRKAKRKKIIAYFFFFNGMVLSTEAYRI